MNRLRAILEALGALAVLVAFVAGVPLGLLGFTDWPITGIPSAEQLQDAQSALLSDDALIGALVVALWVAWALLGLSVLAEIVAQLRGVERSGVNLGGPIQRLVGFLVGSVVVSLASPAVAGATPALQTASAPELPAGPESNPGQLDLEARDGTFNEWVTYLGDQEADTDAPFEPASEMADSSTTSTGPGEVTVGRDDTAWSLAEQHLGDGMRWREIWQLNKDVVQADGSIWDNAEDDVQPGWNLVMPTGEERSEPPEVQTTSRFGGADVRKNAMSAPPERTTAARETPTPQPDLQEEESVVAAPGAVDVSSASLAPVGLAGAGITLAGVVLLLERRRRAQQRHRGRGRAVEMPAPALRGREQELRYGAAIEAARLLDVALRASAARSGTTGLPPLRWVETTDETITLVADRPSLAPPGFKNVSADRWTTSASFEELEVMGAAAAPPMPALMPLGVTDDGIEILADLEASGVVSLAGEPDAVAGLLRAMAVVAATAPWHEQTRLLAVGMPGGLTDLPWVNSVERLEDAVGEAEAYAELTANALGAIDCSTTAQARAAGVTPEQWDPLIVLSATRPEDPDLLRRLDALSTQVHSAVAVVVPAPVGATIGREVRIHPDGGLGFDGLDLTAEAHHLTPQAADDLVGLLDVASRLQDVEPNDPAAGDTETVRRPAEVSEADDSDARSEVEMAAAAVVAPTDDLGALLTSVDVLVRVMGDVEAVALDQPGPGSAALERSARQERRLEPTRQKGLEAATYLALRESAVYKEDLEAALFPDGRTVSKTFYNTVSSVRALVGEHLFPQASGGRYEISKRVVTDYGLFCSFVAQAEETEDAARAADRLTGALSLVRGEPFMGVGRSYAWVGAHRGIIVAQVIDCADELGEVRLAMGDWRAAEWAARQGLRAFPTDERMYRLLMRTARAAGNAPGVMRVFQELCEVIADPDLGVEPDDTLHPETVELFEELTGGSPRFGKVSV